MIYGAVVCMQRRQKHNHTKNDRSGHSFSAQNTNIFYNGKTTKILMKYQYDTPKQTMPVLIRQSNNK